MRGFLRSMEGGPGGKMVPTTASAGVTTVGTPNGTSAVGILLRRGYADDANLLKTPLYEYHVQNGGRHGG